METIGRKVTDVENDPRSIFKLDISFTRQKLFGSLIRNMPKMFPNDMLECEIQHEENSMDMYLEIKRTTKELK